MAVHVSQSFDVFHVYGKDPQAVKSTFDAFAEDLAEYSAEAIDWAFKQYRKTNKTMPTPSDIISLIRFDDPCKKSNRPEYKVLNGDDKSDWKPPTPAQREEIRALVQKLEEQKKPRKKPDPRPMQEILSSIPMGSERLPQPLKIKSQEAV